MTSTPSSWGSTSRGSRRSRSLAAACLLLLSAAPLAAQDERAWHLEAELSSSARPDSNFYGLRVAVHTDLPDGTLLKVRLFYLAPIGDEPGETTFLHARETLEGWAEVAGAEAEVWIGRFARPLPPVTYRARVTYAADDQPLAVRQAVGDREDLGVIADCAVGGAEDLQVAVEEAARRARRDFERVEAFFVELRDTFLDLSREPEPGRAWAEWRAAFARRVDDLARENEDRFEVANVWIERRTKMAMDLYVETLHALARAAGEALALPADERADALTRAQERMGNFLSAFRETRETLGLLPPPDRSRIDPLLAEARRRLDASEAGSAEWMDLCFRLGEALPPDLRPLVSELAAARGDAGRDALARIERLLAESP